LADPAAPARQGPAKPEVPAALGVVSLLVLSAVYLDYVFRLRTGIWLRAGLGDWQDPYFINGLLEQWRFSVLHLTNPVSPPMFFPERGTLGYSHTLAFYAPAYIVFRLLFHPFIAYTLTILFAIEAGIVGLYILLRRFLVLGIVESLVLVGAFATSQNVINGPTGVWTQRVSVFLIPPILLIGFAAAHRCGWLRELGLGAAALLGVSLLTQDVYTGLLGALAGLLLSIGVLLFYTWPSTGVRISIPPTRRPVSRARRRAMQLLSFIGLVALPWTWVTRFGSTYGVPFAPRHHHWERPLLIAVIALAAVEVLRGGWRNRIAVFDRDACVDTVACSAGAVLGFLGFLYVYYDAFVRLPGFTAQEVMAFLVQRNPAEWTHIVSAPGSWLPYESGRSFVIIFTLAVVFCVPWVRVPWQLRVYALWLAAAATIVLLLPMRIGDFAPWTYVSAVPGFSAVRDPKRIIYPFELAIAIGLGVLISRLPRASLRRRIVALFIALVVIVKWNTQQFEYERPIEAFESWVAAPIAVDESCRSFFIKGASDAYMSRARDMASLYGTDAVFIATTYAIPTLNGFSAWAPPGWKLANPPSADYPANVDAWIARHHLMGVCELDIDRRTMTPHT
jgi:hypothetical protein